MSLGLVQGIDELLALDPDALSDDELHATVIALQGQTARLEAAKARLTAAWHARRCWATDGSRAAGARLAREARLSSEEGNRQVRRARKLRTMPHTAEAFAAGELSADHVDALGRCNRGVLRAVFGRDEQMLVTHAKRLSYSEFLRMLAYWLLAADPDGDRDRAKQQRARRYLNLVKTFEGCYDLRGFLDPVAGATVAAALQRIVDDLAKADVAEARDRLGHNEVTDDDLWRTPGQRRADALVELAERAHATAPGARKPRPLVTVVVDYETFTNSICELDDQTVIGPGQLLPILGRADIERIVFGSGNRILEVSVREQFFKGALRRAIEVRDRHCQHPSGCHVPANQCHVDHEIPRRAGGPTTQYNGRLYCAPHNWGREQRPPPAA
jgi:hypothetical protein